MMTNVLNYTVTSYERNLIECIEEIGYGEIYAIKRPPKALLQLYEVEISEKTADFLKLVRQGQAFDRVVVHDSEPSIAEYERHSCGFRCLQKIKF
jgi:hypothetical protein